MSCRDIFVKVENPDGQAPSDLLTIVDNQGYYVVNNIPLVNLLTGLTVSIDQLSNTFLLTNFTQSGSYSACNTFNPLGLTGGPITSLGGGEYLMTFTQGGILNINYPNSISARVLIIGAGSGGHMALVSGSNPFTPINTGGGGGAAGEAYDFTTTLSNGNYNITIGEGGLGATVAGGTGLGGGNTIFANVKTAVGGNNGPNANIDPRVGANCPQADTTPPYNNNGSGSWIIGGNTQVGGGGGGAGAPGGAFTQQSNGIYSNITGATVGYAGGADGGIRTRGAATQYPGGYSLDLTFGQGAGGADSATGFGGHAENNKGGGGGGGGAIDDTPCRGGNGGSGVVYIRWTI